MRKSITWNIAACLIALLATAGCGGDATYTETTGRYKLPPELNDCKVFGLGGGNADAITVVRCPAMATTTTSYAVQSGKTRTTRTIAAVE